MLTNPAISEPERESIATEHTGACVSGIVIGGLGCPCRKNGFAVMAGGLCDVSYISTVVTLLWPADLLPSSLGSGGRGG